MSKRQATKGILVLNLSSLPLKFFICWRAISTVTNASTPPRWELKHTIFHHVFGRKRHCCLRWDCQSRPGSLVFFVSVWNRLCVLFTCLTSHKRFKTETKNTSEPGRLRRSQRRQQCRFRPNARWNIVRFNPHCGGVEAVRAVFGWWRWKSLASI